MHIYIHISSDIWTRKRQKEEMRQEEEEKEEEGKKTMGEITRGRG